MPLSPIRPHHWLLAAALGGALLLVARCGTSPRCVVTPPTGAQAGTLATFIVVLASVPETRALDGVVEAVNEATVAAQTSGRVAEILYDVNDVVPAGAVILRLRGTEQRAGLDQAEAALQEVTARRAEARQRLQRISDIYARGVVPRATLDEATANSGAIEAQVAAARAAADRAREGVAYTQVKAPFAGIVTQRHVRVGETVTAGTPLMSGMSLEKLRVVVDVPQSLLPAIRAHRQGQVIVNGNIVAAAALTLFPVADASANTFRVRLDLPPGTQGVQPGMFVKTAFVTGMVERMLIPFASLVQRGEVTAVYVAANDGTVALRQVRAGHRFANGRIEVLAGLSPGEKIARDPAAALARRRAAGASAGAGAACVTGAGGSGANG